MGDLRNRLSLLDIDQIKKEISERMRGRTIRVPQIPADTFVYRARKLEGSFSSTEGIGPGHLSYPPAPICPAGRLNRKGFPIFYAATSKSPLLFELGAQPAEHFIFSIWQMQISPIISCLGYTHSVFTSLGSKREAPQWLSSRPEDEAATSNDFMTEDILSELFSEKVLSYENDKYKLTAAIAEIHYELLEGGAKQFAGVIYPSVAMWANGDNIALRPWFVDKHLQWKKSIHIKVDSSDGKSFEITELDSARDLDGSGKLQWAGYSGFRVPPGISSGHCVFTEGRDELGDYIYGKDNVVGHWVLIDEKTGRRFAV